MQPGSLTNDLAEIDRRHHFHPGTHLADFSSGSVPCRVMTKAKGVFISDSEGREYLDGFAGLYCVNVGYGREEIAAAVHDQILRMPYYHAYAGHTNEQAARLAERIVRKARLNMNHVYFGMSGSDANETSIKLVWYYNNILGRPQKKKIISRVRGYHGSGLMTGSLTGLPSFHTAFDLPFSQVIRFSYPHYWRFGREDEDERTYSRRQASELETLIRSEGADTIAAFIAEPVIGTGGIIPPPAGYWEEIQLVLKKFDILLIADEVVTGFGRTGYDFASHRYDIRPDLMTTAKGVSSGYLPLSCVIVGDPVWHVLEQGTIKHGSFGHGWTYAAHPACAAAANANLDIIEQEGLVEKANTQGEYMLKCLREELGGHPMVGEVRGIGLMAAVELVANKQEKTPFASQTKIAQQVANSAFDNGLIIRPMPLSDTIGLAPPFIVSKTDIDRIVSVTSRAIALVHRNIDAQ